jgi:polyhydroxyalkanoate synthase
MAPDLPGLAALSGVRREVERTALRARNGIKWVAGAQFAPLAPTPSEVIWTEGKVQLRRYRRATPAPLQPPVLAFLGLVGRPYVFDLWKSNSIVQLLMDAGFDAFVLDWGEPDEQDAANTLETYLRGYLPRAINAMLGETGAGSINVMAYCMGGCMALHALAAQPDLPVDALVTIAAPVDFTHLGPLIDALREGRITPDTVLDDSGNLPGSIVRQSFKSRKPTGDLVNYANLWQNLWSDEYMEGYQAIGRWLHDHIPVPGALFRQVVSQWLQSNGFVTDRLRLGGRRVSLGAIRTPVLAVIATRDDITPAAATTPIVDVLTGTRVELMPVDAGHASLFSGRKAVGKVIPGIFDWLANHSKEAVASAHA